MITARVGVCEPSPDGRLLAHAVDVAGDEVYALRFRDLETGQDLPDVIEHVHSMGAAWSADSTYFFYTVPDAAWRSHRVMRHQLGARPKTMSSSSRTLTSSTR